MGSGVTITSQPIPVANPAEAGVLGYTSAGVPYFFAKGSGNQTLSMNSGGTALTWSNPAGASVYTILETLSPVGVSTISTSASWSGYKWIIFRFNVFASSGTQGFYVTFNGDTGNHYQYSYRTLGGSYTNQGATSSLTIGVCGTGTAQGGEFTLEVNPSSASSPTCQVWCTDGYGAGNVTENGSWTSSSAATGATFQLQSSTNFGTGSFIEVYGVV